MPGNAIPTIAAFGLTTDTYFWMSALTVGSSLFGPSASSGTGLRIPYFLIVADPASDNNGIVIPLCRLKAASVSTGS